MKRELEVNGLNRFVDSIITYDNLRAMSVRYHVIPSMEGGWQVQRFGANRATSRHSTQSEAVDRARELAKKNPSSAVIVHGVDGTVRSSSTYGKGPYPPREQSRAKN